MVVVGNEKVSFPSYLSCRLQSIFIIRSLGLYSSTSLSLSCTPLSPVSFNLGDIYLICSLADFPLSAIAATASSSPPSSPI